MKDVRIATFKDFLGELTVTYKRTTKPTVKITSSQCVDNFIRPYFEECMDDHEEFKIIYLNNSNCVVNIDHLSKGSLTGTLVDVRLAVRNALKISIAGVILVHNHPSSTLVASQADKDITQKLKTAFNYFDIKVLDHLIITREAYYSFADENIL